MHSAIPASDYHVLVRRAHDRPDADLYPFNLRDPMPSIPIPLQLNEPEPIVVLKPLIEDLYDRSGYTHFINDQLNPVPVLNAVEQAWLAQLLQAAALR